MRCIIFGIDALEYTLVKKWNLKEFKQKEYGKVDVSNTFVRRDVPISPVVWASFLTGKIPEKHKIKGFEYANPFLKTFIKVMPKTFWKNYLVGKISQKIGKKMRKSRMEKYFKKSFPKKLSFKTIFDGTNFLCVNVPFINYNQREHEKTLKLIKKYLLGELPPIKLKQKFETDFNFFAKKVNKSISNEWILFMGFTPFLDRVQHLFYQEPNYIKSQYQKISDFIKTIKEKLDNDILLLVISDHGQKSGVHTPYAFYSSNKKLGLKNPRITDFFDIIKNKINPETEDKKINIRGAKTVKKSRKKSKKIFKKDENKEEIFKRLKKMGYF